MSADRWAEVERLYHAALGRDVGEREAFLRDACAGDEQLQREVEGLLAQPASGNFLAAPAILGAAELTGASVLTGRRIGVYQIQTLLGSGGMGEVYRARDTKLGRDVAIKILPRFFRSDTERLKRFEREARVLASLNHPHIGAIYGFEDADGIRALVLELVDGQTLADGIARGPLPLQKTIDVTRQMADALDAAHEKGIVHRDLKPANIKITPQGVIKVLDFGLARLEAGSGNMADAATEAPTITINDTREGLIVGTAAYMSPEQARGQTVDKRTDIWAFGCILYEMLTGTSPFGRETITDTLAAVLHVEPDWAALPSSTPHSLRRLLARCLDKDTKRRLRDIGDARNELDADPDSTLVASSPLRFRTVRRAALASLASVAAVAVAIAIVRRPAQSLPAWATEALTVSVDIPSSTTLEASPPAISADGRQVAWVASSNDGRTRIWTQALATGEPRDLAGTDGGSSPFWSPDGRSIGFLGQGQLKRIEISTGTVSPIATLPDVSNGATWSAENVIVFSARYGIFAVPASGGTPTVVATLNRGMQENQLLYPQFLPDNRHFLYVARSGRPQQSGAYVGSLDDKPKRLFSTTSFVKYAPPGYLLSVREGALVAQQFNPTTLAVGAATTIVPHITAQGALNGRFDVSPSALLAFFAQRSTPYQFLRWFDRAGNSLGDLTEPAIINSFRIAPDGRRVVIDRSGGDSTGGRSVWVYETDGRPPTRVTFAGLDEWQPVWAPDAQRVAFMSYRDGPGDIYVKSLATPAPEEPVITSEEQKFPTDWSADGGFLAYGVDRLSGGCLGAASGAQERADSSRADAVQ